MTSASVDRIDVQQAMATRLSHLQHRTDAPVTTSTPALVGVNVLVVGINYAPEHTGIAPYTTAACEHLTAQGASLLVLAGVPHYPHWSVDAPYKLRHRVQEDHHGVQVHRLRHYVPARQNALKRGLYEASFGSRVATQSLPWSPDIVLAVVPSLFGAAAAATLARRHNSRFVVWVQDLMAPAAAQSGIAGGSKVAAATTKMERAVLEAADEIVVINESFKSYVMSQGLPEDKVTVVRNWSHTAAPTSARPETRARLGWGDDEVIALHSGNMGLKQALEHIVAAARQAQTSAPQVRFVLMGDGNQRAELQAMGNGLPNLTFLPPASNEEFSDVLAAADILLVNERATAVDMSLPSKLTSYFRTGVPVVAAVPHNGGTAAEVQRSGAGVVVEPENARRLLESIVELAADDDLVEIFRLAAANYVRDNLSSEASLGRLTAALTGRS